MPELSALRARLKDRQVKAGALGTDQVTICLDPSLLAELKELEAERSGILASKMDLSSLAGSGTDTTEVDALIEAKKAEITAESLVVVFRALSSTRYQEVVNQFEDPDGVDQPAFLDSVAAASYLEARSGGEKVDLAWDEIKEATGFGELEEIRTKAFNLSRRKQDIPFSLKPSKSRPLSVVKQKPASS